jgi:hypothetical protein
MSTLEDSDYVDLEPIGLDLDDDELTDVEPDDSALADWDED